MVRLLLRAVRQHGLRRADGHGRRPDPGERAGGGRPQGVREGGGEGNGQGGGAGVGVGERGARQGQGQIHAVREHLRPGAVHPGPRAAGVRAVRVDGAVQVRRILRRAAGLPDTVQQLQGALRDLPVLLPARRSRWSNHHRYDQVHQDRRAPLTTYRTSTPCVLKYRILTL